jgi:hypothetical protein
MSHPDEGLIHAWLDGELDAEETARVEALVASDPAWAAAVAEARGLVAASSRIVGALDRVPANVIPKASTPPRRVSLRRMMRAAAVVVLLGGSAVVLDRTALDSVDVVHVDAPVKTATPAQAPKPVGAPAPAVDSKSSIAKKELLTAKRDSAVHDKDAVAPLAEPRENSAAGAVAGGAGAGRGERREAYDAAARAAALPAAAPKAMAFAKAEKRARLPLSCFEQRAPAAPADSARRIIRLDAAALDDSIQLEKLTLRGDTLAAVHGPLIAVRIPCQAP